jgi:hypothetical protein
MKSQQSLFGDTSHDGLFAVHAKFESHAPFSLDLFEGFTSLRVLTYSASLKTILDMTKQFEKIECIFGYEGVISQIGDVIAFHQSMSNEFLITTKGLDDKRKNQLLEQIKQERISFYVMKDAISHSKIYLLESDNSYRVIVGSANFSERAFSGKQAETILVFDNDESAWAFYQSEYERVKKQSSMEFNLPNLQQIEVKFEDVPIIYHANASETGVEVYVNTNPIISTIPEVIRKVEKLVEGARKIAIPIDKPKNGKVLITRKKVGEIVRLMRSQKVDEENQKPAWLSIFTETGKVILSGQEIPLITDWQSVVSDVHNIISYFQNYETGFYGNVFQQQKDYFAFMCWFYFSPFICDLRNQAVSEQEYIFDLPSFAIIYGKSNCGKTTLIETLMQSMFGYHRFIDKGQFTRTALRSLLQSSKRFPTVFDDVDKKQFSTHAPDVIKDEQFILNEYPAFVLSMNADDHTFPTELVKRCLMFYTQASLPDGERAKDLHKSISNIRKQITTSLYHEYLKRIIEIIQSKGLPQDMLLFSSQILTGIMEEAYGKLPEWCVPITMTEYKNKRYEKIKNELLSMYQNNRESWEIKRDTIVLKVEGFEASGLKKDIPDWILKGGSKGGKIIMSRQPLEEFLGISFKTNFISRLGKR